MNLFPNGGFVRLRSRARDKYVYADEDGSRVSLRPPGAAAHSVNAVWKADLWPVQGGNFLLLQGAAYGRYLAVSYWDESTPPGHRGVRALQRDYNSLDLDHAFLWLAMGVEEEGAGGQNNHVRLRRGHPIDPGAAAPSASASTSTSASDSCKAWPVQEAHRASASGPEDPALELLRH